ncbi:MAG: class I SAM-dependent methyltransferase [Candidatus Omnitrophica bacterium]|nr:class I SAM-dependent methyltransferase [Candidatus Omnitrophota bacterium]
MMDKEANSFLYELYRRMPVKNNDPHLGLSAQGFYKKFRHLFEFYEDNYPCLLPQDLHAKVLDIGFGYGMFMAYMNKRGYSDVYGVEYNTVQVENAKNMGFFAERISDIVVYLRDHQGQFDLIHASNVIEHFPKYDLLTIFDHLRMALKEGGRLIVCVPNLAGYRGAYNRFLVLGHETGFTEISLRQLFAAADFGKINIQSSLVRFRLRPKHIAMRLAQGFLGALIRLCDYVYLGENSPKCLGQYLIASGDKDAR